jgi:hypothetical protein
VCGTGTGPGAGAVRGAASTRGSAGGSARLPAPCSEDDAVGLRKPGAAAARRDMVAAAGARTARDGRGTGAAGGAGVTDDAVAANDEKPRVEETVAARPRG